MSDALLDYSSWSFQLIIVLAMLYLVVGLIRPDWVMARRRSTIVIVSVVVMLLASTAFYVAVRPLGFGAPDGSNALDCRAPAGASRAALERSARRLPRKELTPARGMPQENEAIAAACRCLGARAAAA